MWSELLLPSMCPGCRRAGLAPCAECIARLIPAASVPPPPGLDAAVALFEFQGVGAHLVKAVKYANHRDALGWMAQRLAAAVPPGADVVTWVPATASHRRARGFDQAELLARLMARSHGVGARPLLRRSGDRAQTASSAAQRRRGPELAARGPSPPTVLLVDDVRTTGASLSAAATAVRAAGAEFVVGATLAITPGPTSRRMSTHSAAEAVRST